MKLEREYGIDALRIVSMVLIVMLHVLDGGGVLYWLGEFSFRHMVAWFLKTITLTSVNCYALISGYVGVKTRRKASSMLELWIQVVFYSVLLSIVVYLLNSVSASSGEWIKWFFPICSNDYWYYTAYFFISLMMPLLNRVLLSSTKQELCWTLFPALTLVSLISAIGVQGRFLMNEGYGALWLLVLYLVGGYFRLHGEECKVYCCLKKYAVGFFLFGIVVAWVVRVFIGEAKIQIVSGWELSSDMFMNFVSPVVLLSSVSLFALFAQWKPSATMRKWIARIAPATFGVYLIHIHQKVWSYYFINGFTSLVHLPAYILPFGILGASVGVFVVCTVIDLMRGRLFKVLKIKKVCRRICAIIGLS